jgi:DNA polymerase-1
VQDRDALAALLSALVGAASLSFDVETTSTQVMQAELVGLGLSWAPGYAVYIPVRHSTGEQLPWEEVRDALQPFFADPALPKLAHNGSYDLTVLLEHGMNVQGPIHDTMILAWLLDPASRMLGLKAQAGLELGWRMTEIGALIGSGKKQVTIDQVPIETVAAYCGADVDATIQLYPILASRVRGAGIWSVYEQIELPLLPVISAMERAGILLDVDYLAEMSERLAKQLAELARELFEIVGHEFNMRSTQQMSNVLFTELEFPTKGISKTGSGQLSTAASELEKLRTRKDDLSEKQQRVLDLILEQRQLEKLRGTYVDNLPALVNPKTGRLHTSFNQAGAVTGRMSSSDPNLQNIPIRTEIGREIRRAFVAPPGWLLMSADYSQIELRVLAHVAREESFIAAFRADDDIHAATAARLFNVPLEQVTKEQRGLGKTINFATVYGSSAFGISNRTDFDPKQAQAFMDQYFATYPRVRDYVIATQEQANRDGFVKTLLGRKRFFPELTQGNVPYMQRQALERQAINAPIQGAAADIMKIAMVRLHDALVAQGFQARMLLQVHDELVLEFPPEEQERLVALVCDVMENAWPLDVPLRVDVETGPNWYDMQPAERASS